jgi:hypothetical protein
MTNGLNAMFTYTNSKLIDNYTTSVVNERRYRTVSEFDLTHVARLSLVYELPFGPGKAMGSSLKGPLGRIIDGWIVSAYFTGRSGVPLSVSHANGRPIRLRNAAKSGDVSDRIGDQIDPRTRLPLNPYFDTTAFAPLASQFVVSPEPPYFDELRGPDNFGRNLSVSKDVRFTEKVRMQLRGEATNFTNSLSWGNPGTNMSNPATFGVIQSGGGGRSIQLSARVIF